MPFYILYFLSLSLVVGVVELAEASSSAPTQIESPVEIKIVAVPPKPDGVRDVQGEGEGIVYTKELCLKQQDSYRDICFHQLARQLAQSDWEGGVAACEEMNKGIGECKADVAELYAPYDREQALSICPSIQKKKWKDQCVFGIALALSTIDSRWAFRTCDQAGQWRDFCRHDVNGEISVVDLDLSLEHCHAEEGDLLRRKTCWHGIGKYIARVDVQRAFHACEQVPQGPQNLYVENCYHGLGWGASEASGLAFAQSCDQANEYKDSCLLGIAYNLRRFDVDQAVTLCAQVKRQDLQRQCRSFVLNGRL